MLVESFFIPNRIYLRWTLRNFYKKELPKAFIIFAAKLVRIDLHFSGKERKKISKYIHREFGLEYSQLKINSFEVLIHEIDELYLKYKTSINNLCE